MDGNGEGEGTGKGKDGAKGERQGRDGEVKGMAKGNRKYSVRL